MLQMKLMQFSMYLSLRHEHSFISQFYTYKNKLFTKEKMKTKPARPDETFCFFWSGSACRVHHMQDS